MNAIIEKLIWQWHVVYSILGIALHRWLLKYLLMEHGLSRHMCDNIYTLFIGPKCSIAFAHAYAPIHTHMGILAG